jgi:beta-1,4-N-acetylglucosaminyltransferase
MHVVPLGGLVSHTFARFTLLCGIIMSGSHLASLRTGFSVFATVGSTSFDELVRALTLKTTLEALSKLGISLVTIQYGRGTELEAEKTYSFSDSSIFGPGEKQTRTLLVRAFRYAPSLASEMSRSSVILCHGGSGSVFEATTARPGCVVVVPNGALMDDHQTELASELYALGVVRVADARQPPTIAVEIGAALRYGEESSSTDSQMTINDVAPQNHAAISAIVAEELS